MRQPANPFHPGEMLLEEFLEPAGISQASFAKELGWTKAKLNELIKGKRGITADTALDLADALKTSPHRNSTSASPRKVRWGLGILFVTIEMLKPWLSVVITSNM